MTAGGNALLFRDFAELSGTLLDLGGHEGAWTAEMLSRHPRCLAFIVEPVPAFAEELERRFAGDGRVTICPIGLGASTRPATIEVAGDRSSIFREAGESSEPVQVVDVAEWWEVCDLDSVAVMKINIEGGEYEVLPRLISTRLIEGVERLLVQFHSFVPGASRQMAGIRRSLRRTHEPMQQYPFIWERWRRKDIPR